MGNARITKQRSIYLSWLSAHPGATTAELDRACRTARGGHCWMYASVKRMLRAGLVRAGAPSNGRGRGLYVT